MLTAKLSRTCLLFILLSPDLSFFMEAKQGLAVLRILIPRDLAVNCFSFWTSCSYSDEGWINWRNYSSFQRYPKSYICFTRSQKAKLWRINAVVSSVRWSEHSYATVHTVFNLETFSRFLCDTIKPLLLYFWVFWWFVYAYIILRSFGAKT